MRNLKKLSHHLDLMKTRDDIGPIRLAVGFFLLLVIDDFASVLHCYGDTGP